MNDKMKILIVKLSSLGDLIHAMPAVHNLRTELNADIHWVVNSEYVNLVTCFTDVDRVIGFPRHSLLNGFFRFARELRREQYDYVIDLQGLFKSGAVSGIARSKIRIGPSHHRECSQMFYTSIAGKRNKDRHSVEENMDVISYLGLRPTTPVFPLAFPKIALSQQAPRIALFPISRWTTKNWPIDKFGELASSLIEQTGGSVFLFGGPSDIARCAELASAISTGCTNCAGKTNLVEMGSILTKMDLVISNDSGPAHMAAALGIPTIGLFGPTNPKRTGPYGKNITIIQTDLSCQPCLSRKCKKGETPCMTGITPDRVYRAALELL